MRSGLKRSGKILQKYKMRQLELFSEVRISQFAGKMKASEAKKKYKALWDTGSDFTAITRKVIDDLGLRPLREISVRTANGVMKSAEYFINVVWPGGISKLVRAVECVMDDETDVLIGMDIIASGDFAISSDAKGNMYLAFRVPSEGEVIF